MTSLARPGGRIAVATLAASVLFLSACGSSSGGGSAGKSANAPTGSATGGTAPKGTPVKIGAYIEQTGVQGDLQAGAAKVTTAWAKSVNAHGGIAGHPVDVEVVDTGATASTAIASATKLAAQSDVVAVLLIATTVEGVVAPIFAKAHIPVFGVGYQTTVWGKLPNFFTAEITLPAVIAEDNLAAKTAGATRIGADVCAENPACAQAAPLFQQTAEQLGMTYGGLVKTSINQPSFTAECLQFISSKVDLIHIATSSGPGLRLAQECVKQGYKGRFGIAGFTLVDKEVNTSANANLKIAGYASGFPWWSTSSLIRPFLQAMKTYGVAGDQYKSSAATGAWTELSVFAKAMTGQLTSPTTPATRSLVLKGYGSLRGETLNGLLAQPVSFTVGKPSPAITCAFVYTLTGGKYTSPAGEMKPSCIPA